MGKVYQNVTELIGHTPLLEVQNRIRAWVKSKDPGEIRAV